MKIIIVAGLLFTLPLAGFGASFGAASRGTTTAPFLRMGAGARATGMGEAYTAVADDASALYWNPASLTRVKGRSVNFTHVSYLESTYYDYLAFAQNMGSRGAWGASFQYFSAGDVKGMDAAGAATGNFTPNDRAFTLGYAREVRGFGVGLSGKFIRTEIVDPASTVAADIGVLSPALAEGRLRLAAGLANLGGKIKFDNDKEALPMVWRAGGAFEIRKGWLGSMDLGFPRGGAMTAAAGTEYEFAVGERTRGAGRIGYNSGLGRDVDGFTGLSLGLGLGYQAWQFDYGFMPMGSLGAAHRISVCMRFGRP